MAPGVAKEARPLFVPPRVLNALPPSVAPKTDLPEAGPREALPNAVGVELPRPPNPLPLGVDGFAGEANEDSLPPPMGGANGDGALEFPNEKGEALALEKVLKPDDLNFSSDV